MTGASAALRASVTGWCPAQRISDRNAAKRVTDIVAFSVVTEKARAKCHRCGLIVGVTRRWDDGRWRWSPWRYDAHVPPWPEERRCNQGHLVLTRRGAPYCAVLPGELPCTDRPNGGADRG